MFIQVIEGKASDPERVHRQIEVWERDLMPGAIGYLGSTGGCTASGDCILVARFESREAAQANSDRPEQGRWWAEMERCFDEPPTFHDSVEVDILRHGSLEDARFVQVMEGHVTDRKKAAALEQEADPILAEMRPDVLGSVTAYYDDNCFTEIVYFTSEAQAREGERRDMPPEMAAKFDEWEHVMKVERYLDIPDPWLLPA